MSMILESIAHIILAQQGNKRGLQSIPPQSLAMISIGVIQYAYQLAQHKMSINAQIPFFSKSFSAYYQHGRLNYKMILHLFVRGLIVLLIRMTISITYIFSFKGDINIGIIATIY
jgi:hypothetical protein